MSTATTSPLRRPRAVDRPLPDAQTPLMFWAAVVAYRQGFWAMAHRPAREAFHICDDACGLRFWKSRDFDKIAAFEMLRLYWPEDLAAGLPEKMRFIKAVRESALGCLR